MKSKKGKKGGFRVKGKSPGGETYPAKASGLAMKSKTSGGTGGESYPSGDLQASPA